MFTIQISDRDTYVRKATSVRPAVTIVPLATVVPIEENGGVIMHPALRVDYSMEFEDHATGKTKWTFREVVRTDEQGNAELPDYSLWKKLQKVQPSLNLRVLSDWSR